MKTRAPFLFAFSVALGAAQAGAATRIALDGPWEFRLDTKVMGFRQRWQLTPPGDTETVTLPHTWGVGRHDDYLGTGWYFKTVTLPDPRPKHLELHVGAAFYRAHVYFNGSEVGVHEGGHTSFFFDVTPLVRRENVIAIEVGNQPSRATIPGWALRLSGSGNVWYDWWPYGGLVRGAWLVAQDRAAIRRQEIRGKVDGDSATVTARVFVEGFGGVPEPLEIRTRILAPATGKVVAEATRPVTAGPGSQDVALSLAIPEPKLWHFDDPDLYRVETRLVDKTGAVLDVASDNLGLRTVEVRDRGLFLNGERVRLTGITRHEESPWEGLAETAGTIRRDWDDLKDLQVTLTRPVHYPQHPDVLDYADRNGILLVPEIPVWQFSAEQLENPAVLALAKKMMKEMIEQAGNHPSVFAWSVCNESATSTPAGREYVKAMRDYVRSLDPDRYVTYADDGLAWVKDPAESAVQHADFIMMNQYFGTWHAPAEDLPDALERVGKTFPDKMVIISEFGVPGVFAQDARGSDELRVRILREQLAEFGKHDWIGGALLWCYQDYKSFRNLWPGQVKGYVDHGVVDENRQRRPSYDAWKEATSPARVQAAWRYNAEQRPVGFQATVSRRPANEIPSYELRGYRAVWETRDVDGKLVGSGDVTLPTVGAAAIVEGSWTASPSRALDLRLRLLRPTGFAAAEAALRFWEPRPGGMDVEELRKRGIDPKR